MAVKVAARQPLSAVLGPVGRSAYSVDILKSSHGGSRPGAGKPKGYKHAPSVAALDKAAMREYVRQRVALALESLIAAQVANAQGLKYLVTRDKKTGKFIRVTEAMARLKQGDSEEHIEVWEKDPSVQAFTDLLNRALDKPAEQVQELKLTGTLDLVALLQSARKRLKDARS